MNYLYCNCNTSLLSNCRQILTCVGLYNLPVATDKFHNILYMLRFVAETCSSIKTKHCAVRCKLTRASVFIFWGTMAATDRQTDRHRSISRTLTPSWARLMTASRWRMMMTSTTAALWPNKDMRGCLVTTGFHSLTTQSLLPVASRCTDRSRWKHRTP